MKTECTICKKSIERKPNELEKYSGPYCRECQSTLYSESSKKGAEKRYINYIERWKQGLESGMRGKTAISRHIIRYLFEKYDNSCAECGWGETNPCTGNIPLEVEHKDGDFRNNHESNLTLLCPSCHSLTCTYKGANKGNGRPRG